jgi:S-adenosylmethionine synthetase
VSKEQQYIQSQVVEHIINKVIPSQLMDEQTNVIVNGTGRFEKGGPHADAGLTGRKIIVDTYGGMGRHGGGAFSGKDPSKVDRSAAYASRWAAKHIIAAGLAQRCEIQLAYAIGVAEPVSIRVESFGTGTIPDSEISERLTKAFDFRPAAIISELGLLKPIFKRTAAGGHFGRVPEDDGGFSWEALDQTKIAILQNQ